MTILPPVTSCGNVFGYVCM